MRQIFYQGLTATFLSILLVGSADAQATRHRIHHHRHVAIRHMADHRFRADYYHEDDRQDLGRVNPAYGYEEAPYDPRYHGPGATIFNATRRAAQEPGVTNELAPDAKETATGGPSGGVPGFGGH